MRLILRLYNNTLAALGISAHVDGRSFFDYSSREKKRIIKEAAEEANRMQKELVEEYYRKNSEAKGNFKTL